MIDIRVPVLPESVSDATIVRWHQSVGAVLRRDEALVDLETDKVILEVVAAADGISHRIDMPEGSVVKAKDLLGILQASADAPNPTCQTVTPEAPASNAVSPSSAAPAPKNAAPTPSAAPASNAAPTPASPSSASSSDHAQNADLYAALTPSERRQAWEHGLDALKRDLWSEAVTQKPAQPTQRVPMTRIRAKIAERLLMSKQSAAMLTTFNEVNLATLFRVRETYKDLFEKKHGVRLGWMSFFVQAAVAALQQYPIVNASIEGNDVLYHGFLDIGIAISTQRGLVVPIIRHADQCSIADIERHIVEYAKKARNNQLSLDEMTGGTFTITNGGVFGSLLSTPIINPPQTAILGMHQIQERPIVENGQIVIRPMMYLALSYDHRLIDGEQSVRFLVAIKHFLEDPMRAFLKL